MTDYMDYVSNRIVALREEKGETQQELADAVGITRQSLSRYEIAARTISIDALGQIAQHYNVSVDYLMGFSDVKTTKHDMKTACEVTGLSEKAIENIQKTRELFFLEETSDAFESDEFWGIFYSLSSALCAAKRAALHADTEEINDNVINTFGFDEERNKEVGYMKIHLLDVYERAKQLAERWFKKHLKEVTNNAQHHETEE